MRNDEECIWSHGMTYVNQGAWDYVRLRSPMTPLLQSLVGMLALGQKGQALGTTAPKATLTYGLPEKRTSLTRLCLGLEKTADLGDTRAFGTHTLVWPTGRAGRQLPTTCKAPATQTPCKDIHMLARALPEKAKN